MNGTASPAGVPVITGVLWLTVDACLAVLMLLRARREARGLGGDRWRSVRDGGAALFFTVVVVAQILRFLGALDGGSAVLFALGVPGWVGLAGVVLGAVMVSVQRRRASEGPSADQVGAVGRPRPVGEDPGWLRVTNGGLKGDGLTAQRTLFLAFLSSLALLLLPLSAIVPFDGNARPWFPVGLVAWGVACSVATRWIVQRPLITSDERALAGAYRTRMFLGISFAQSAALMGFVGPLAGGGLWLYLVGLVFSLPLMLWIAPGRRDIAAQEAKITASGSPLDLTRALIEQSGPPQQQLPPPPP